MNYIITNNKKLFFMITLETKILYFILYKIIFKYYIIKINLNFIFIFK